MTFLRMARGSGTAWWRYLCFRDGLGLDVPSAYALQALVGFLAAMIVAVAWARNAAAPLRNAAVVLATLVATPYLQDYDLVVTAFVAAWMLGHARQAGFGVSPAIACIALLLALPLLAAPLGVVTGLAVGPTLILPSLVWVVMTMLRAPPGRIVTLR